jgi:Protein of unknown function (DUF2933)
MFNNRYVGLGFGLVAAVIVLRVLGVSLGSFGLLAVVLACPLMMFFMMKNMGGMGNNQNDRDGHQTRDDSDHHRV